MGSADTTQPAALPAGYFARGATRDDAPAVAQLRTTCQAEDGDTGVITADEQLNDWLGSDLAEDTVLVFAPDGSLAAYADIMNRRYINVSVYGGVHPEHRHHGLGAYLVRWGEAWIQNRLDRAPADAQVNIQHYINTRNESAVRLMEASQYSYAHTVYVMSMTMDEPPPAPEPIEGVRIRAFVPGQDERATFDAVEDAFRDIRGRPAGDYESWLTFTENERREPGLWHLAADERTGEIAGVCLTRIVPGGASWVGAVGVRRPWRQHGLALSLLRAAFGELYRRGERKVELSVDAGSPTGAPRLYTRAGMHMSQSFSLYRKQVRPGRDYSTLPETASAEAI